MRLAVAVLALLTFAAPSFAQSVPLEPPAGRVISGWSGFDADEAFAPHAPAALSFEVSLDYTPVAEFLKHYREFTSRRGFFLAYVDAEFRGAEHDVSIGMRDPDVMVLADGLRDAGRPVLISFGPDFNKPGAAYEASSYIGAFRHAVAVFHQDKVNFAAVWSAHASAAADTHYMKWYPGDDVVDWWGLDASDAKDLTGAEAKSFIEAATHHHKPVLISFAPTMKSETDALKAYGACFSMVRTNLAIKALTLRESQLHWPKVTAYLKQQFADPHFIDVNEAPSMFRPKRPE